jgi:Domain of unknown function (DUF3854)
VVGAEGFSPRSLGRPRVNPHLDFLLSVIYEDSPLHPEHLADLRKSGLTNATIALHKIRTVPPAMIEPLLGFVAPKVVSAYILPFPDLRGGWMDHVKLKVFSSDKIADVRGDEIEEHHKRWRYNGGHRKYLVRRRSAPRLYVPLSTMEQALESDEPLWLVEGMKKALAVSQLGVPSVGLESAWSWHMKGSSTLLPDFAVIALRGRVVELVPDSDVQTNPMIARAVQQLADALRSAGARPRLVRLPADVKGADDFIEMKSTA